MLNWSINCLQKHNPFLLSSTCTVVHTAHECKIVYTADIFSGFTNKHTFTSCNEKRKIVQKKNRSKIALTPLIVNCVCCVSVLP